MITGALACIYSTVQYGGYIASGRDEMGEVDGSGRGGRGNWWDEAKEGIIFCLYLLREGCQSLTYL